MSTKLRTWIIIVTVAVGLATGLNCERIADPVGESTTTTSENAPLAPSDLSIVTASGFNVALIWADNSTDESGFRLQRRSGGFGSWDVVAVLDPNNTSFNDTSVAPGVGYEYRVLAFNSRGNSAFSNEVTIVTESVGIGAPSNLVATIISISQINLAWQDNSDNETGFQLERKAESEAEWTILGLLPSNMRAYQDSGLSCNTQYSYRVNAFSISGRSTYSLSATATTPKSSWQIQPGATRNDLVGVARFGARSMIAVGSSGTVIKSSDAGVTWKSQAMHPANNLNNVWFSSGFNGVIVGNYGNIFHSTDAGATWTLRVSGTNKSVNDVHFFSTQIGMAVADSGIVLTTTNGGATWTKKLARIRDAFLSVYMLDQTTAVAVGVNGRLMRTTDFGDTWTNHPLRAFIATVRSVIFMNSSEGIAVGGIGAVLRTTDGGSSWMRLPNVTTNDYWDVGMDPAGTLWIVGTSGTILRSVDGGLTWAKQLSPTFYNLRGIVLNPDGSGIASGSRGTVTRLKVCSP